MKVWRIKLQGARSVADSNSGPIESSPFVPTRRRLLNLSKLEQERGTWSARGLMGYLIERYEDRYKRNWNRAFTPDFTMLYLKDMERLMKREDPEDISIAIRVLFSPRMKWVNFPVGALFSREFFEKCLALRILEEKETHHGEQAEYRGNYKKSGELIGEEFWGS